MELNNYVAYAHNLGGFDGIFIYSALASHPDYTVKGTWKDKKPLKIKITHKGTKNSIVIFDSCNIISGKLEDALKSFECEVRKGVLPYEFYTADTLHYVGEKPAFEYYNSTGIDISEWNKLPAEFNAEEECTKYLEGDIYGLLELMSKFIDLMFTEYNYDATLLPTFPGMAYDLWGSLFYQPRKGKEIKFLRGSVASDIRSCYYGGNVNCYKNSIEEGYVYDVVSQFPSVMLKEMPVGDPVYTTKTNLAETFGWVFGEIIPPVNAQEQHYVIINRGEDGKRTNPKEPWYGGVFSEEMKEAIEDPSYFLFLKKKKIRV